MPVAYGLADPVDLPLPHLVPALDGLRIAHLTDLHVTRPSRRLDRLAHQLSALKLDLVFFTGDYMIDSGDEPAAIRAMTELCRQLRPRLGSFGVFGNHDTTDLYFALRDLAEAGAAGAGEADAAAKATVGRGVRWLRDEVCHIADTPIEIMGLHTLKNTQPDAVDLLLRRPAPPPSTPPDGRPLRLLLAHYPSCFPTAADLGADVMFSGHTHGGQIRFPTGHALCNACDLPLHLTSGLLRHQDTLVAISRGLGEVGFPRVRFGCRPHAPIYTLRKRSMPGRFTHGLEMLRKW